MPKCCIIDHSTTQRKLCPFLGVWQATRKDDAAECKSNLDLLPEDLSLSCFGEGKLTQRSKQQGYRFFLLSNAIFLVAFLPCQTPPPNHVHESLPDHFRPCPQNTWAPYHTARLFHRLKIGRFSSSLAELFLAPDSCSISGI